MCARDPVVLVVLLALATCPATAGELRGSEVALHGEPARVLVSTEPAILIQIDGEPVLHPVQGTRFQRVINTCAAILQLQGGRAYFLRVYDGWLSAPTLAGPWSRGQGVPWGVDEVAQDLAARGLVDLLEGRHAWPAPSLADGVPTVHVATEPTELLVLEGEPDPQPTGGARALPTDDTTDVFVHIDGDGAPRSRPIPGVPLHDLGSVSAPNVSSGASTWYALSAGVWFAASSPTGPWAVVSPVPPALYGTPASAPLHYVTLVEITGGAPSVVYQGHAPGYLGTVVAPGGVVGYGTGSADDLPPAPPGWHKSGEQRARGGLQNPFAGSGGLGGGGAGGGGVWGDRR